MSARGDLAVVIPARNEFDRISATVKAAARIPGVDLVVVVDDGSNDGTGAQAEHASTGATLSKAFSNGPARVGANTLQTGAAETLQRNVEEALNNARE